MFMKHVNEKYTLDEEHPASFLNPSHAASLQSVSELPGSKFN
jgi:hypothetical protein